MRKAFWPLVAVLGVMLAFGAINGGTFQPKLAEADISFHSSGAPNVWWFDSLSDFDGSDACENDDQLVADVGPDSGELNDEDVIFLFLEGQDSIWICVNLTDETQDNLEFDSNDYGTWEDVLCANQDGDDQFDSGDFCDDVTGLGTDTISIDCDDFAECDDLEEIEGDVAALFQCDPDEAGEADITISQDNSVSFRIFCFDEADSAEIACVPCTIEIVPALGNTAYALVYAQVFDSDDNPAEPGAEVTWLTDNCEISDDPIEDVLAEDTSFETFDDVIDLFEEFEDNPTPGNADDIEDFVDDVFDPDWDDEFEGETFIEEPFDFDQLFEDVDTYTAVVLNCSQGHDSEPGVATLTVIIEVDDDPDIVEEIDVTVIGPPATITAVADQASVRCGERVLITVTIKDAKGANVSDHTLVEAVTNFGGVLGGTGAVAGQQGLVVPVSSTLAETIKGVATFYLLTSETHSGPYEIIISTGGGGAVAGSFDEDDDDEFDEDDDESQTLGGFFSTGVLNARATTACTIPAAAAPAAPAPAPTVRAPSTGGGSITPPATGDAGLADASGGSSWLLLIGGVTAFALAGAVSFKLARR
jgi:hypothetical protein